MISTSKSACTTIIIESIKTGYCGLFIKNFNSLYWYPQNVSHLLWYTFFNQLIFFKSANFFLRPVLPQFQGKGLLFQIEHFPETLNISAVVDFFGLFNCCHIKLYRMIENNVFSGKTAPLLHPKYLIAVFWALHHISILHQSKRICLPIISVLTVILFYPIMQI